MGPTEPDAPKPEKRKIFPKIEKITLRTIPQRVQDGVVDFFAKHGITVVLGTIFAHGSVPLLAPNFPGYRTPELIATENIRKDDLTKRIKSIEDRQQELGGGKVVGPVSEWIERMLKGGERDFSVNFLRIELARIKATENVESLRDWVIWHSAFIIAIYYLSEIIGGLIAGRRNRKTDQNTADQTNDRLFQLSLQNELLLRMALENESRLNGLDPRNKTNFPNDPEKILTALTSLTEEINQIKTQTKG